MEEKHLVFNAANYQMISNAAYFTRWLFFLELRRDSFPWILIWYQFTELFFSSWTTVVHIVLLNFFLSMQKPLLQERPSSLASLFFLAQTDDTRWCGVKDGAASLTV